VAALGADHPQPGGGRVPVVARRLGRVIAELEGRGCAVVVRRAGPAAGMPAPACEAGPELHHRAAGGDGTINAVVNGMALALRPLALLPLGTANVLARETGCRAAGTSGRTDRVARPGRSGPAASAAGCSS
jgi:diacylglycerol kinase family enzyme